MSRLNRRGFMKKSSLALAGATFAISGTKSSGNILGSNERIRVAVAGLHGRGKSHISAFAKMQGVEIACLIDPDTRQFDRSVKRVTDINPNSKPQTVQDVREALDDGSLDVVSVATPNHWHSLITIWACQADKDVYVEKPCSHNVHEGRIAVEAARRFKRIVQHGTQRRSSGSWAKVVAAIKSGKYGKLKVSRGFCYKASSGWNTRGNIGFAETKTPPSELDFNIWLGPAPDQRYHENLVHYRWHWFWDFGNGDVGNQGVHQMDVARWGIPGATLPKSVISVGGRFGPPDQGQVANTQITIFDYGDTQLIFDVRGLKTKSKVANEFYLEEGSISDGQFYPKGGGKAEPVADVEYSLGPGGGNNFANFIAAVRSRNVEDLNADILEGHYSSALCHLGNISYRLGAEVPLKTRVFSDNTEAAESFEKMKEHLASENGFKLKDTKLRLGRFLKINAENETFVDDQNANTMLTRNYRRPFIVPDKLV